MIFLSDGVFVACNKDGFYKSFVLLYTLWKEVFLSRIGLCAALGLSCSARDVSSNNLLYFRISISS